MAFPFIPLIGAGLGALGGALFGGQDRTDTQRTTVDPQSQAFRNLLLQGAQGLPGFSPFGGQRFAGIDPQLMQGFQGLAGGFGGLIPNLQRGQELFGQAAAGPNINQFFNPFQEQVIGGLQGDFERQQSNLLNQIGSRARAGGAFGGSRQGIAEGVGASELARQQGNILSQTRQQGFQNALQAAQGQQAFQAGLGGQLTNLGLTGLQGRGQAQLGLGGLQQQQAQQQRDFAFQEFIRQQQQPFLNLQAQTAAAQGAAPFRETTTQLQTQGNPFAAALGGGLFGLGLGGASNPFLSQLFSGLFGGGGHGLTAEQVAQTAQGT